MGDNKSDVLGVSDDWGGVGKWVMKGTMWRVLIG